MHKAMKTARSAVPNFLLAILFDLLLVQVQPIECGRHFLAIYDGEQQVMMFDEFL